MDSKIPGQRRRPLQYLRACGWLLSAEVMSAGCGGGGGSSAGGGGTPPPPPPPPPPPSTTQVVNVSANQIVHDFSRQVVYASVGSADTNHPNTLALIDPRSATVTA